MVSKFRFEDLICECFFFTCSERKQKLSVRKPKKLETFSEKNTLNLEKKNLSNHLIA